MKKTRAPKYLIKFTKEARQNIRALPKGHRNALRKELVDKLGFEPEAHSQALHERLQGFRSFHWNDQRIVLMIFEDLTSVAIVGVGTHSPDARKDLYRRLESFVNTAKSVEGALVSLRGFTKE